MIYPRLWVLKPGYFDSDRTLYAKVGGGLSGGHTSVDAEGESHLHTLGKYWSEHDVQRLPQWSEVTGLVTEEEFFSAVGRMRCSRCGGRGYMGGMHTMVTGSTCWRCEGTGTTWDDTEMKERQTRLFEREEEKND